MVVLENIVVSDLKSEMGMQKQIQSEVIIFERKKIMYCILSVKHVKSRLWISNQNIDICLFVKKKLMTGVYIQNLVSSQTMALKSQLM